MNFERYIECPVGLVLSPSYCTLPPETVQPMVTCSETTVLSPAYCQGVPVTNVPLPAAWGLFLASILMLGVCVSRNIPAVNTRPE